MATGFAIKATGFHSGSGAFILPNGFDAVEMLSGVSMSRADVKTALATLGANRYIIEQYVGGQDNMPAPGEYKIHMFNGNVGSIIYTTKPTADPTVSVLPSSMKSGTALTATDVSDLPERRR